MCVCVCICMCACVEIERTVERKMHVTLGVRNRMFRAASSALGSDTDDVLVLSPASDSSDLSLFPSSALLPKGLPPTQIQEEDQRR